MVKRVSSNPMGHHHDHSHDDHGTCAGGHHHHHGRGQPVRLLSLILALTALYMGVEFIGGIWTNSLALLADAGHMLTDVASIALALIAAWFAHHPPSAQKTYGYYRLEIFAAFLNGIALALIAGYIIFEAWERLHTPAVVNGSSLMLIATGGLLVNLICAGLLHGKSEHNLNIRAAMLHVMMDALGSLAAIISGFLVWQYHLMWADPVLSVIIALLVLYNAWLLIKETTNILLEGCPVHLDVSDIEAALIGLEGVDSVHDLHVWCITTGKEALSAHVTVADLSHFTPQTVTNIQTLLKSRFGLTHITVQLEPPDFVEDEIHF